MAQAAVLDVVTLPEPLDDTMILKEGLRFVFSGFAVWLELEQFPSSEWGQPSLADSPRNDLEKAIHTASQELNVYPIPAPHMTALYGIDHLSEQECRMKFKDLSKNMLSNKSTPGWPMLRPSGFLSGVEVSGAEEGGMNMAWIEASFETSTEHEKLLDQMHEIFYKGTGKQRSGPWSPHISLAYDNEECPISNKYLASLVERHPTLALPRKVEALSLWNLNGRINEWSLVDRIQL